VLGVGSEEEAWVVAVKVVAVLVEGCFRSPIVWISVVNNECKGEIVEMRKQGAQIIIQRKKQPVHRQTASF
jgi:hypothetical protein